jgi:hypothetical protein
MPDPVYPRAWCCHPRREEALVHVIESLDTQLFERVTGLTLDDFHKLSEVGVFHPAHMKRGHLAVPAVRASQPEVPRRRPARHPGAPRRFVGPIGRRGHELSGLRTQSVATHGRGACSGTDRPVGRTGAAAGIRTSRLISSGTAQALADDRQGGMPRVLTRSHRDSRVRPHRRRRLGPASTSAAGGPWTWERLGRGGRVARR